ncbi:DUF6708 domain-containing protein [Chromohalobacter sarecensis]|uniref:DUF6708 domain-containing protein n=1 Tax=Chromohalobacter sarecensis TaxID=245294 RepID=A0ABV9D304_9GAMM|nr:DUF6708 domain-containing protein [Chromohalobacter sarecensis]MCK0714542.1 hypothetical protein [Chromohalobacter sarecensis]
MRSTIIKDLYSLLIKANWGFSSTMSKSRGLGGNTQALNKKSSLNNVESARFNDSTITVSSTCLEVVDPGNRLRGINSVFGIISAAPIIIGTGWLIYGLIKYSSHVPLIAFIFGWLALFIALFLVLPASNTLIRWDMFRKTHYPMRFNRRDRKVYAWSQDMGVVTMNWDDIQFYTSEATKSQDRRGMSREEIRGFVRDRNGNMLYHLVFFKYEGLKGMKGVLEIWELVRRYMEEPDGHIQAYQVDQRLLDLEGKRESFIHSLIQATQVLADSRAVQLIFAPMVMWAGTGRIIAKWTCRVPRWPAWVEEKCQVAPNDPYVRNRHNERPLTAKEILWPLFCFLLGWAEVLVILYFCFRGYF